EHLILLLGALRIKCTHCHHVGFNILPLCQQFAAQLGCPECLEHVLSFISILVHRLLHCRDRFLVGVGINDHLILGRTCAASGQAEACHCHCCCQCECCSSLDPCFSHFFLHICYILLSPAPLSELLEQCPGDQIRG